VAQQCQLQPTTTAATATTAKRSGPDRLDGTHGGELGLVPAAGQEHSGAPTGLPRHPGGEAQSGGLLC